MGVEVGDRTLQDAEVALGVARATEQRPQRLSHSLALAVGKLAQRLRAALVVAEHGHPLGWRDRVQERFGRLHALDRQRGRASAARRVQVGRQGHVAGPGHTVGHVLDVAVDPPDLLDDHDRGQRIAGRRRSRQVRGDRSGGTVIAHPLVHKLHGALLVSGSCAR